MGQLIQISERVYALKALRNRTQLGLIECKKALEKSNWDLESAHKLLRLSSEKKANSKAEREAKEGAIITFNHNNRIGVIVEVNCETDFAAKTEEFNRFCENLSMHIIGACPLYISDEDIPEEDMSEKAASISANSEDELDAAFEKWYDEVCLLRQTHVNPFLGSKTIEQLRQELSAKLDENVIIKRFIRWELG